MPEIIEPSGHIVPSNALVPYVHPTLTNKTPVVWPLLLTAVTGWAVLMIDWGTMRWMDHAPDWAWVSSTIIALCVLAVIQNREWLNFRNRRYFPLSISFFMLSWFGVAGVAYYQAINSPPPIPSPEILDIQTKLAAALRDRDIAISERDAERRAHGDTSPSQPIPPIPSSLEKDEIDARIDAWGSISAQMTDLSRIFRDGDDMVKNWKTKSRDELYAGVNKFRGEESTLSGRLQALIGTNSQFSDLSVIDQHALEKLTSFLTNLMTAISQTPKDISKDDLVADIVSYVGPIQREVASLKQWVKTTKNVAESSVLELRSRQQSTK